MLGPGELDLQTTQALMQVFPSYLCIPVLDNDASSGR